MISLCLHFSAKVLKRKRIRVAAVRRVETTRMAAPVVVLSDVAKMQRLPTMTLTKMISAQMSQSRRRRIAKRKTMMMSKRKQKNLK